MNIVAILANGVGARFGSNVPKQFHKVNGKMVIEYVIESMLVSGKTDKLVIATNIEANSVYLADICAKNDIDMIAGGDTRNKTLKNVITYIDNNYDCDKLIVCDAVRPMVTPELMDRYFDFLDDSDAVVTAQKITDSLGCYDFQQVDRERYYLMQSPEGFDFRLLADNFDEASPLTEVTQQLPPDSKIHLYFDFNNNFKLTYPADLKYLEALVTARDNDVDFSKILENVSRLNKYLEFNYPTETKKWAEKLERYIEELLKEWQITEYRVIKTSHFGIIFLAKSVKYGKCVLKIIPPFIDRYMGERSCYQSINSSFMCELYDFNDSCSAILLERCADASIDTTGTELLDFFNKVLGSSLTTIPEELSDQFKSYAKILEDKQCITDFEYNKDIIMDYVARAVKMFKEAFDEKDFALIHGDLHRYNIMEKNGELVAIDPIGYIAPREIDIARFIGTELTDSGKDIKECASELINYFSAIADKNVIEKALFIDIVFRLHNSLFENDDYELTNKWLNVLSQLYN